MGNRASAERACKDPNPIIDGRKANVNLAILGAKPRGNITPGKWKLFFSSLKCHYLSQACVNVHCEIDRFLMIYDALSMCVCLCVCGGGRIYVEII